MKAQAPGFDYAHWLEGRARLELDLAGYRRAAVLVALTREPLPRLLLTVRSADLPTHAGQISFPGGRLEPGETVLEAALREAWEEVGLLPAEVEPLGLLDDTFTPAGYQVTPVLARVPPDVRLNLSGEVSQLLLPPLAELAALEPQRLERTAPDGTRHQIYRFLWTAPDGQTHDLWGMTARIVYGLLHPALSAAEY